MKICQKCGGTIGDTDFNCPKCGAPAINAMPAQMQQPVQMQQPNSMPMMGSAKQAPVKNKSGKSDTGIIIAGIIILILAGVSIFLGIQNKDLKSKLKKAESNTNTAYKVSDNLDTTSNQVQINATDGSFNFEIPEGTYPKVSQNYVFFIPEAYAATVIEQSGGLSLLNLTTGGSGWISMNNASLEAYRGQKEALKETYINQGVNVHKMYDTVIGGQDALVLEIINDDQPTLLIITDAPEGGCFVLTVNNSTDKTKYDTTTADELVRMLATSKRIA